MMETCCVALLFIGVVTAAPTAVAPSVTYDQAIASAIDTYNQEEKPEYVFRLLEAEPQPDWQSTGATTQSLKFSIKETVCRSSDQVDASNTQCDYNPDGVDRDCSGFFSPQQSPPTIIVQCEDVQQELNRITRLAGGDSGKVLKRC
ncbi:cathelicidin-related peptide Oh-Cath-like isoform X1 [Elgaria multicarinata webbii]|uniref:cathelicidin-related peptide Oh-Cath-like isoform X1 n=1 Tax=Elgaria multicarinata webbii TaxID=159646 RepID=UPI002FCD3E54